VPTMIVLVNLKEGASPEEYERWIRETYSPAVKSLKSIGDWRGYRTVGMLESNFPPPYRYIVVVEVENLEQLGKDVASEEMQRLLTELGQFAEPPTQIMTEKFA
jgi:hypothetical protein